MITGAVLIFIAPLSHIYLPKKNKKVEAYRKLLDQKISGLDKLLVNNLSNFKNNSIDKEAFLLDLYQLECTKTEAIRQNKKALNEFKKQHRVFGWSTMRVFILGFGVRLPYLLLSIIISYLVFKINTEDKYLKKWFVWLQLSCYTISFYFMFWVFWTSQDFPLKAYPIFFIVASFLASVTTVSFISYIEVFKHKTSKIIGKLIVLLFSNDKYMETKEKSDEYIKDTVEKIEKIIS